MISFFSLIILNIPPFRCFDRWQSVSEIIALLDILNVLSSEPQITTINCESLVTLEEAVVTCQ